MSESKSAGRSKRSRAGFQADRLLTPSEVAALFGVNAKKVSRWPKAGRLATIRTLGGHRRFRATEVYRLLAESSATGHEDEA